MKQKKLPVIIFLSLLFISDFYSCNTFNGIADDFKNNLKNPPPPSLYVFIDSAYTYYPNPQISLMLKPDDERKLRQYFPSYIYDGIAFYDRARSKERAKYTIKISHVRTEYLKTPVTLVDSSTGKLETATFTRVTLAAKTMYVVKNQLGNVIYENLRTFNTGEDYESRYMKKNTFGQLIENEALSEKWIIQGSFKFRATGFSSFSLDQAMKVMSDSIRADCMQAIRDDGKNGPSFQNSPVR